MSLCLLQCPCICPVHQCRSYRCPVYIPLHLHVHFPIEQHSRHSLPVVPPALHSVGDFRIQFSILRQRRMLECECLYSLSTVSPCTWISAYWCSLHPNYSVFFPLIFNPSSLFHCSSPFLKLPFYMISSSTAQYYYIVCQSHHIQYHVKQVGAQ